MSNVLVTGGAGFIGSHLVEVLLKKGYKVRVIDNFITGKKENLAFIQSLDIPSEQIEIIEGDIREIETCRKVMEDIDYVLHQAALPSVPRSIEDPFTTNEINIKGTLNLLWAAKEKGIKRFIYASSSSVYGDQPISPKTETLIPQPLSPYAGSKLAGEYYCSIFYHVYGLETVSLRYFNVFGPRQDPNSPYAAVIPKFITAFLQDKSPEIYGDGEQTRDFTYVLDVVTANILAMKTPGIGGEVFNIAYGQSTSINQLAGIIKDILQTKIEPIHVAPRPGDIRHSLASIEKAKKQLNYFPKWKLEEGLKKTVEYYLTLTK